ncbi:MAG: CHAT domain-containing protein [Pyrinomonadaceae bacterium]
MLIEKTLMILFKKIVFATFISALSATTFFGQAATETTDLSEYAELKPNEKIERPIKTNERDIYKVFLKRGELFHVTVKQNGINLAIAIADASGKVLKQSDEAHDTNGTESLYYLPETEGALLFGVFGFQSDGEKSNYVLQNNAAFATDTEKKSVANALYDSGTKASDNKNYELAVLYYETALNLQRELPELSDIAFTLSALGSSLYNLKNYEKAVEYFKQSSVAFHQSNEKANESYDLWNLGLSYYFLKQYSSALDYLKLALNETRELKDTASESGLLLTLGGVSRDIEQFAESLEYFEQALKISREIKDREKEMKALTGIGLGLMELGEYEKAIQANQDSLKISQELKKRAAEADALMNIGLVYTEIGEYDKPFDYYNKALQISEELKDRNLEANLNINTGVVYFRIGSYAKSGEYFAKSLKIGQEIDDKIVIAVSISDLGNVATRLKQYDKAIEYYEKAIPMQRDLNQMSGVVISNYYYGIIMRERGNFARAIALHQESVSLAREHKVKKYEARSLYELGVDYLAQNRLEEATMNFQQALLVAREIKVRDNEARALDGLMNVWNQRGSKSLAIFYGKQAVNLHQTIRRDIKAFNKENQLDYVKDNERTYRQLADLLIAEGRLAEAQAILQMLKEEEFAGFVRRDSKEIAGLAQRADLRPDEKNALEKYNSLAANLTKYGAELTKLDDKKKRLAEGEHFPEQAHYDELTADVKEANTAFRLFLEKQLAAELGKEAKKEIEVDRSLQGKLAGWGAGTVAVYTVIGEDRYRVILTTSKTQVDGKTEIKAADLNQKIFAFRAALRNPSQDPRPLGLELYNILIKPIEKDLQGAEAKTLLWSLDGALRYVPIGALWDGQQYLAQKYQTVMITSATRQSLQATVEHDWRALGAGVTKESQVKESSGETVSFDGLPSVANELQTIVKNENANAETGLLIGKRYLDADFTVDALKNSLGRRDAANKLKYNVVHLATHFRLGSDTASSFLLLGGNRGLTLEEVSDSPDIDFTDVELVTLSACNTAFGNATNKGETNGKEVDSLAAFIENRGAKAVMATLWSVADESTELLMAEFYRLHKENPNMTKAEAMQQAQIEMIAGKLKPSTAENQKSAEASAKRRGGDSLDDGAPFAFDAHKPYAHPYFWSPFMLIGNWR